MEVVFLGVFLGVFYQSLRVQHSCSSTQSWGSVLPSIVEMRDQNSQLFFVCIGDRNSLWEVVDRSRGKMHFTCLITIQ